MKRIAISIMSLIILLALILGVLPVAADESHSDLYRDNLGEGSAVKCDYPPLTTQTGRLLTFAISATDSDNDPLIYSASNLPPGATFDPQTRTFSWTPGYDQAGIYPNVRFTVSDGEFSDSEDITITVINVNRPPALDFIGDKLADEGELIAFTINATDFDYDPLTYTAQNLPSGATFDPQTRTFSWTPVSGQQGSYPGIRFQVSDGELTDFEDITIVVRTSEEAVFSVHSLKIRPGKVSAGKAVRISVLATNIGTVAGSCEVSLKINGAIEDNKIVALSPGATEEVNFVVVRDVAGVYMVDVNGLSDSFVVREINKARPGRTVSLENILSKTVGWIRTMLN